MDRLKAMKETLMSNVQAELCHLESVDTKELGEAVDMIKDLAEAVYYCTVTEAMEKNEEKQKMMQMQPQPMYYTVPREQEWYNNRMMYGGNAGNQSSNGYSTQPMYYTSPSIP